MRAVPPESLWHARVRFGDNHLVCACAVVGTTRACVLQSPAHSATCRSAKWVATARQVLLPMRVRWQDRAMSMHGSAAAGSFRARKFDVNDVQLAACNVDPKIASLNEVSKARRTWCNRLKRDRAEDELMVPRGR